MIDIEQRAITTFQTNLAYFAQHHPALHQKLTILQSAIETGQYKENYSLEYIEGYFDVKELSSGGFLYGSNSLEHARSAAKSVNLKKDESVIETFYDFPYTKANVEDLDKLTIINSAMVGTAPIVRFVNEHMSKDDLMQKIYKFIFFGVGVGEHLSEIHKKIDAESYLIIEDDLELFRLSLFVTDYPVFGKRARLFFSIMDSAGEFKETYNFFSEDLMIRNSHLKFYLLSDSYAPKIKQIQNFAVTQSHLTYPYNYLLHKNLMVSHAIYQGYYFLNISRPFERSPFAEKPILYLAAGPSLDAQMEWVKTHQESFVIVCVFMITAKLEQAGVRPDIIVHVDEAKAPVENTLRKLQSKDFLKESLFILAASAPLALFAPVSKKENIFLIEDRTRYKKDHGFIEFFSVGEVGYALSLIFGAKAIYLLGLDLAVDQKTGKTHADGHNTTDEVDVSQGDVGPKQMSSLRDTLITVKGNHQATVLTTPLFDTSIHRIDYFTRLYRQSDQQVYNLSDGAFFEGTIPLHVKDIGASSLDENVDKSELHAYMRSRSSDTLSDIEKNNIIIRKKEVKKKAKSIERFAKQNIRDIDVFRREFTKLIGTLITPVVPELNETSEIFLNYFQNVGNYIGNLLNTASLKQPNKIAKELQRILSRQLYKILHDIGSFEFDYINGKKYFDVDGFSELQNETLDLKLRAEEVSQIDQYYFLKRLRYVDVDQKRLREVNTDDVIGFLAFEENLQENGFVEYIKQLYSKFPNVRFEAFGFVEYQKDLIGKMFDDEMDRIEFVIPTNVYDICEAITIYIQRPHIGLELHDVISKYCMNIYIAYFDESKNKKSVYEQGALAFDHGRHILSNLDYFGYTFEDAEKVNYNYLKLYYYVILKRLGIEESLLDDNKSLFELFCLNSVEYALKSREFIRYFYNIRNLALRLPPERIRNSFQFLYTMGMEELRGYLTSNVLNLYNKYIDIQENDVFLVKPYRLMSPDRFDIMFKYLYAWHMEHGVAIGYAQKSYKHHIGVWNDFVEGDESGKDSFEKFKNSFDEVLSSVKKSFDPAASLVPVDKEMNIIDGSHRSAACLLYGQEATVVRINRPKVRYDFDYFRKLGTDIDLLDAAALQYAELNRDTYLFFLFPIARNQDVEVEDHIKTYGTIIYSKEIALNAYGAHNLIIQSYRDESWVGDAQTGYHGAAVNAKRKFKGSARLKVYLLEIPRYENTLVLKENVRSLFKSGNDPVHITDTYEETLRLSQQLFNRNSLHFLNNSRGVNNKNFMSLFKDYRQKLKKYDLHRQKFFCIDSSSVLAAYGIRDARDIDYLYYGDLPAPIDMEMIDCHNEELCHYERALDEMLFDPANYFYYDGVKFLSLDNIKRMKKQRNEEKDRVDVHLIEEFLNDLADETVYQYREGS